MSKQINHGPDQVLCEGTKYETEVFVNDSGRDGPVGVILGGQHGIEPAGWMASAKFATAPITAGKLIVIPYANANAIREESYSDGDIGNLNRKWKPDEEPSSDIAKEIWEVIDDVPGDSPSVFIDNHTSGSPRAQGGVGQCIFPTKQGRGAAKDVVRYLNEYCMSESGRDYHWTVGNNQNDRDDRKFIDRVGWLLGHPGYIVETARAGTSLQERIQWQTIATGRLLRENGIIVGY